MAAQIEQTPTQLSSATGAAPILQTGASHGSRMLFIDNLRILLISMVLVVHLDDTYGAIGSWDYHDPATNLLTGVLLTIPNAIGMASGMGFFFLLAGYFTPGPYDRKGPRSFLRDRLVRLGIPLLLYDLLLHPLVVYIGSGLHGSYWSFYGTFLLQMRGVTGVVWFLAVLLLFDLLYAAWRGLTRHRTQTTARTGKLPSYRAIFGFIFALGLVTFVVRIWWTAGWIFQLLNVPVGYLPQYISLYILGLIAYRRNWFFELTPKMGRDWSLIALMATLIILGGLVFPSAMQEAGASGTRQAGYAIAGGFNWLAFSYALWESFKDANPTLTWSIATGKDVADTLIRAAEIGEDAEGTQVFGGCDLIVLATHGRGGLERWMLGSVTEHILGATRLPMLIIRPQEQHASIGSASMEVVAR